MKRTFIITGGNSGLGLQCARNIALQNADNCVVIASRNTEKSIEAVEKLRRETQNTDIHSLRLNLASLQSVREFVEEFGKRDFPPLYGIACNAISGGGAATADGFDMTFGTGHLGHFLLVNLLLKQMCEGRIMFVSSDQHDPPPFIARLRYTDALDYARPNRQNHNIRYSFTKLCNIYTAYELSARLQATPSKAKITVNAFNPGFMADTGLATPRNAAERFLQRIAPLIASVMGVRSSAPVSGKLLAGYMTIPEYEGITGKYFDRAHETKSSKLSYNRENALNLWNRSVELTQVQFDESVHNAADMEKAEHPGSSSNLVRIPEHIHPYANPDVLHSTGLSFR
ncbi:MAG: SDR family NAD(P)-dependent oxidoreductase [Bacteroidales bacterium]|jgi:NAD(P)-dependent dehydrogenase (short-subunit alcohol dehydrogenase family)|nr:SDR family NAD(P)-dependent oxidoreductase [Bacteroidales bacterium]